MKNKNIIIVSIIIAIVALCITIFCVINTNNTNDSSQTNIPTQTIKSTKENKIEKGGLEAKKIDIQRNGPQLIVVSTIVNNSSSSINGFFMEIVLLNKDGEALTSVIADHKKEIKPHESLEFENHVVGDDINIDEVVDARVGLLEKY